MTAIPTHKDLMQPVLDALRAAGGSASNAEIEHLVLSQLELPHDVAQHPHSNSNITEVQYRLHWARTYLKKAGLIANPKRGVWALTESGRETTIIDAAAINQSVRASISSKAEPETPGQSSDVEKPPEDDELRSLTPHIPDYTGVRHFLRILDGVPYETYRSMYDAIWSQRGTPQSTTDWSKPEEWIPQRLDGAEKKLSLRIWRESQKSLNPRYVRGAWYLVSKHRLLTRNDDGILVISERGQAFLTEPVGSVVISIDIHEGIHTVLQLVAEKGPGRRGNFLPAFTQFCHRLTTLRSENAIKSYLSNRILNLVERGYVERQGHTYEVTEAGLAYLDKLPQAESGRAKTSRGHTEILKLGRTMSQQAEEQLAEYLLAMDPIKFEELIRFLLEEMGYSEAVTTSPTNDKGVDVMASIELGITSVKEVIQVKRHRGSLSRPVLDQLRGSLHRFDAVRGTIITTGRFSKGARAAAFERGAAPITLIDGKKLLGLLMEHELGVKKRSVEYFEFDPTSLAQFSDDEQDLDEE